MYKEIRLKNWWNRKEVSAGRKRLKLTWWIYNHFGLFPIKLISFFITLGTIIAVKDIKIFSQKYFQALYEYTNNPKYQPTGINMFRQVLSYSNSLIDKMLAYSDNYKNIKFNSQEEADTIINLIKNRQGAFFLTNHVGSIEMLRAFIASGLVPKVKINVFLQQSQCKVFNDFVNSISTQQNYVEVFPVEEINVETAIGIKERINNGEFVFMAGDRISKNSPSKTYKVNFLGKTINLPLGAVKFALILDCPIFLTCCPMKKNNYTMHIKPIELNDDKKSNLDKIKKEYAEYLEKSTLDYPYQFYNFYDIFEDD